MTKHEIHDSTGRLRRRGPTDGSDESVADATERPADSDAPETCPESFSRRRNETQKIESDADQDDNETEKRSTF